MKSIYTALTCFLILPFYSLGQVNKTMTVKAGSTIAETLTLAELYLYPTFTSGVVYYKDGRAAGSRFNYNLVSGEMQFVSSKNDTLSVANETTFKYVVIAQDTFYFDNGYLQLRMGHPLVKLAKQQRIRIAGKEKIGAYGQPSSTSAIDNYDQLTTNNAVQKLVVKEDLVLNWETLYFIGDENDHFLLLNKKNLLDLFPKKRDAIKSYLKTNNVNFNSQEDAENLTKFLQQQ